MQPTQKALDFVPVLEAQRLEQRSVQVLMPGLNVAPTLGLAQPLVRVQALVVLPVRVLEPVPLALVRQWELGLLLQPGLALLMGQPSVSALVLERVLQRALMRPLASARPPLQPKLVALQLAQTLAQQQAVESSRNFLQKQIAVEEHRLSPPKSSTH